MQIALIIEYRAVCVSVGAGLRFGYANTVRSGPIQLVIYEVERLYMENKRNRYIEGYFRVYHWIEWNEVISRIGCYFPVSFVVH